MAVPVKNDFTNLEHVRAADNGGAPLIQLRNVGKTYRTAAGDFNALNAGMTVSKDWMSRSMLSPRLTVNWTFSRLNWVTA